MFILLTPNLSSFYCFFFIKLPFPIHFQSSVEKKSLSHNYLFQLKGFNRKDGLLLKKIANNDSDKQFQFISFSFILLCIPYLQEKSKKKIFIFFFCFF